MSQTMTKRCVNSLPFSTFLENCTLEVNLLLFYIVIGFQQTRLLFVCNRGDTLECQDGLRTRKLCQSPISISATRRLGFYKNVQWAGFYSQLCSKNMDTVIQLCNLIFNSIKDFNLQQGCSRLLEK